MVEIGSALDKAIENLARDIAEESKGRLDLGLISGVISELMCRIDAWRPVVLKKRRKAA